MISMTGYAWREKAGEAVSLSVEIKGYNSRYLEISVNAPLWLSSLEPGIREHIAAFCGRGKVEVQVRIREHNAPLSVSVNKEAARAYMTAISSLATDLGVNEKPSLAVLLGMEGVLEVEKNRDDERDWQEIEPVLLEAAEAFNAERIREGKHTEEDILKSISSIETSLDDISSRIPALESSIKENIRSRFAELLGDKIDENRVLAETALLLMKYTISEEISRLSSHLAEFRAETARNQRPGKKLDFLCQEINREINTIGSKSVILEVSRAVVEMKEALENVREQLRNVE
jgi:uncharacterized protein (TIGR00255 family)